MAPTLLIIQPSRYVSKVDRRVVKIRRRSMVPLTLPYLAALTPPGWHVRLVDEALAPVPVDEDFDLVALSTSTMHAYRAYDLANMYRRRGIPVIMGGPHVFEHPDEALQHCDAIGIGEGEGIWPRMLEDAAAGRLQSVYRASEPSTLIGLPYPRYELLGLQRFGPFRTVAFQTSRGCPFACAFCTERLYLGTEYRCRPVGEVVEEVQRSEARNIFFADSNFGGKRSRAMALMEALIPLRVRWSTLWSVHLCTDTAFMDLAQQSGLLHLNIGLESLDPGTLAAMNKRSNKVEQYHAALDNLRRRSISYSLNFIFGWDGESRDAIRATAEFLYRERVPVAYFNILTPDPGTELYAQLKREGRLLHPEEIGRWPGEFCFFQPTSGTPAELEGSVRSLYRQFYSLRSMISRLSFWPTRAGIANWVLNFSEHRAARATQSGGFATY